MNQIKHTPTPWIVYKNSCYYEIKGDIEGDGCFQQIGDTSVSSALEPDDGLSLALGKANAEFIAQACNAYDDLVEALEVARIAIGDHHAAIPMIEKALSKTKPDYKVVTSEVQW